jgi:hypothetical protein
MTKFTSRMGLLAGILMVGSGFGGCSSSDGLVVEGLSGNGSVRLALQAGDQTISTVTAVISGKKGFETQTHTIDVSGTDGVISIYFGNLPVGRGYNIELTAGPCNGSTDFDIVANETTLVKVALQCGADTDEDATGGVQITGTLEPGSARECFHILKIVGAPSVQNGSGPASRVEVVLNDWVTPTSIAWSTASTNGGAGTIGEMTGGADEEVTFDCSANGTVSVIASVTAPSEGSACTELARVNITCTNQAGGGPRCGDGIINQTTEQCDGAALPPNQPAGTTCSATCTLVPPGTAPRCGDGIINQMSEQCDGAALPPNQPAGTTCSATCTLVPPGTGPRCGDNMINQASEQCDGTALPPNQPAGTTCSATCTLVPPTPAGACLSCAQTNCPTQYANAVGSASSAANLADVTQLFDCVIAANWEAGGPIPQTSCFFADPAQPLGSLVPCYCGNTPQATCLATGPANNQDACGLEVELASDCSPVTASCVTASGSNPEVPLGDALQLLNCERAACRLPCGFPAPIEE